MRSPNIKVLTSFLIVTVSQKYALVNKKCQKHKTRAEKYAFNIYNHAKVTKRKEVRDVEGQMNTSEVYRAATLAILKRFESCLLGKTSWSTHEEPKELLDTMLVLEQLRWEEEHKNPAFF